MAVTHSPEYVEAMQSPGQPRARLSQNPRLAAAEREKLQIYEETWADIEMRGFKQASVIRFCPWDLTLDGPAHNCRKIPGVPIDPDVFATSQPRLMLSSGYSVPYTHHVITTPYITVGTRFRGHSDADSTTETKASVDMPLLLAKDMAQQQNQYRSQGGIVVYDSPELHQSTDGKWLKNAGWVTMNENMPLEEAAQLAFGRMITHMNAIMDQATAANLSGEKELMREIRGNRFRQSVQYLLNIGTISDPPKWFMQRSDSTKRKSQNCTNCHKQVELGVLSCTCGYILDPFDGYGKVYDETMPGGMMAARRMTKAQLQTLNLYPRIKPLDEFLKEQNEADKEARKGSKN